MRLLVLSDTPFAPPIAGNRARIAAMLQFLRARGATLGMLLLHGAHTEEWDREAMRAALSYFEMAGPPDGEGPSIGERARARGRSFLQRAGFRAPTLGVDEWCPPWLRQRAAALAAAWRPDVVLVEYVFLSGCLPDLARTTHRPPRTVIDTHDVMHRRRPALEQAGLSLTWFHTSPREERRGLLRADLVLAINDDDAAALRVLVPERTVLTVPHGLTVRPFPMTAASDRRLLFLGSHNDLNVSGLRWFFDHAWPLLRARVPDAELVVCGSVRDKLGPTPCGVRVMGIVEDLAAQYAAARAVIVPLVAGTGLKIKLVEALCHGRPVVSTAAGAVGCHTGPQQGILVADDPEAFATALDRLLIDDDHAARTAAAATDHARRRYSPEAAFGPLLETLAQFEP